MIILPDKTICRTKVIMPVPKSQWMPSSQFIPKDQFGNDVVRTRFVIKARLNDGHVKWKGIFEDRDDFDAFLFALLKGSLIYEKELWKLPNNEWSPDVGTELTYSFLTITKLTSTTQSTYARPFDWSTVAGGIYCVGAGGSGGVAGRTTSVPASGCGGGGGGFGQYTPAPNLTGSATYICGTGGTAVSRTTAGATVGNAGTQTWFGQGATSYATAIVGANGGGGGGATNTVTATGGAAAAGKGTLNKTSGRGGNISMNAGTTVRVGTGGGGGAGYSTGTTNGVDATGASAIATNGGDGTVGAGGIAQGGAGGSTSLGYESGGGGAGDIGTTSAATGGAGGNYGGGGGGVGIGTATGTTATGTSGTGAQGSISVEYIPITDFAGFFNLPILGM